MLSDHQLLHLNAILNGAEETKNLSTEGKNKWMKAKKVKEGKEDEYLDKVVKDAEKIKKDGVFPDLEYPSRIHDYIEKETNGEFLNG